MWDPARAVYSRWDDAGNVVDYPGEEHALTGTDLGTMTPVGRDQLLLDTCRVLQATSPPSAHEAW